MNDYPDAMLADPPREDNQPMITPTDVLLMRIIVGLLRDEVAAQLDIGPGDVRDLERGRTHVVFAEHARVLTELLERVNDLLESEAERGEVPEFLITFPNDDVFSKYEPELSSWMGSASVHRMFIARLMVMWMQDGYRPTSVELVPAQYEDFLRSGQRQDSPQQREEWARAHVRVIRMLPGVPYRDIGKEQR